MATVLALTPDMLLTVAEVYKKTGILIVKDRDTGKLVATPQNPTPFARMKPYGQKYDPVIKHMKSGEPVLDENHKCERVIQVRPGGDLFPNGIPVGVTLRYQRKQLRDFGGDDSFVLIGGQDDVSWDEWKSVETFARMGRVRMTDDERRKDEKEKEALRAKRVLADMDPTTALAKALAPLLAQLAAGKPLSASGGEATPLPPEPDPVVPVMTAEPGMDMDEEKIDLRTKEGRALKAARAAAGQPA